MIKFNFSQAGRLPFGAHGVDTVPLAGATSEKQIASIISDVSWLAYKWNKPLGSRLMISPGRPKGEMTAFTAPGLVNTKLHWRLEHVPYHGV